MANIEPLKIPESLDETRERINRQFTELDTDIKSHKTSTQAHSTKAIKYEGSIPSIGNAEQAIDYVNSRVNTIISGGSEDKDPELTDLKTPDPVYTPAREIETAGDIVRDMQKQFSEQLAETVDEINRLENEKATKGEVNALATNKANQADLIATNHNLSNLQNQVSILDRGWGGTYATLSALQSAFPTGDTKLYVVAADGHWYYWSGSMWMDGGAFQATAIDDSSVAPVALNVKFDYYPVTLKMLRRNIDENGNFVSSTSRYCSDIMLFNENYRAVNTDSQYKFAIVLLGSDNTPLGDSGGFTTNPIEFKKLKEVFPSVAKFSVKVASVADDTTIADGLKDHLSSCIYLETNKYPAPKVKLEESRMRRWLDLFPESNFDKSVLGLDDFGNLRLDSNISSSNFHRWLLYSRTDERRNIYAVKAEFLVGQATDESNRLFVESSDGRIVWFNVLRIGGTPAVEAFELNKYTGTVTAITNEFTKVTLVYPTTPTTMKVEVRFIGKSAVVYVNGVYHASFSLVNKIGEKINKCGIAYRGTTAIQSTLISLDVQYQPQKIMHISIDDTFELMKNLTTNKDSYASLFDHPTFAQLKEWHEEYGAVFSFYLFWSKTTDSFTMADVTTKFKTDFTNNAHWLKFGYHSMYENTYSNTLSDADLVENVTDMHNAIANFASVDNIDRIPRFGFFSVSQSGLIALRNQGLILGALTADDNRADNSGLSNQALSIVRKYDRYTDVYNKLEYFRTEVRFDSGTAASVTSQLNALCRDQNNNQVYIMFAHSIIEPTIEAILEWVSKKNDIVFDYPQNII